MASTVQNDVLYSNERTTMQPPSVNNVMFRYGTTWLFVFDGNPVHWSSELFEQQKSRTEKDQSYAVQCCTRNAFILILGGRVVQDIRNKIF